MTEITQSYIDHIRTRNGKQFYRKKPLEIEAYQINETFHVETLEGTMKGKSGDYVLIGIENEMYICDQEIFKKSYDFVKNSEEQEG